MKNLIDHIIGYFSPVAGLRRAQYRAVLEGVIPGTMMESARLSYEGAKIGRRTSGWITSDASANAEIGPDLSKLRQRSRELIRNNHFAAKAAIEFATKIVGAGITARTDNLTVAKLWDRWQADCSADGLPHIAAIQALVVRTVFESGEVLIRRRTRTATVAQDMAVPIQLQVLEPDYLDTSKTGTAKDDQGNNTGYIIQGVEFNSWGQRIAYWLFNQHPGEVTITAWSRPSITSSRIPASEVLHVFEPLRPGQVRGVPHLAPVMLAMRDLDDWEDAELSRKRTESCLAAVIVDPTGAANPDSITTAPAITDSTGTKIDSFRPGMIAFGTPGFDVKFNQPNHAGGYEEYKRARVRDIAIGIGSIYEILSGDQSQTNYSSYRAGLLGFRDRIESLQWNVFVPAFDRIWKWFIQAAQEFAELPDGDYPAQWQPPAFDLLDREAEAKADMLMLLNGTMTWPQAVQRQGYDPQKQIAEIQKWKPVLDPAGVAFTPKPSNPAPPNPAQKGKRATAPTNGQAAFFFEERNE